MRVFVIWRGSNRVHVADGVQWVENATADRIAVAAPICRWSARGVFEARHVFASDGRSVTCVRCSGLLRSYIGHLQHLLRVEVGAGSRGRSTGESAARDAAGGTAVTKRKASRQGNETQARRSS